MGSLGVRFIARSFSSHQSNVPKDNMSLLKESVASFREATKGQHRAASPPSVMNEILHDSKVQGVAVLAAGSAGTVAYKRKEVKQMVEKVPAAAKAAKEFVGQNPALSLGAAVVVGMGCVGYALYSWWTGGRGEEDQGEGPEHTRSVSQDSDRTRFAIDNATVL